MFFSALKINWDRLYEFINKSIKVSLTDADSKLKGRFKIMLPL